MSGSLSYWSLPDSIEKFQNKRKDDFFRSELEFLDLIKGRFCSVLDIGCASGRLIEVLKERTNSLAYTGIDFVEPSIRYGRERYPDARFILGNVLEIDLRESFDLVYAIGVFQHVAGYDALLPRMSAWAKRFMLFDVKFANTQETVADLERSFCMRGQERTHMVLLSWPNFRKSLTALPGISCIHVWGYETPVNTVTHIEKDLLPVCSATLLVEKGESEEPTLNIDLPEWLS